MPSSSSTMISSPVALTTSPGLLATITWPESTAAWRSMPVPTIGASGRSKRHCLALHVRAHQGAVGVVVLQERDQRRRDRDDLLGRHVHVLDAIRRLEQELLVAAHRDARLDEMALLRRSQRSPGRSSSGPPRRPTGRGCRPSPRAPPAPRAARRPAARSARPGPRRPQRPGFGDQRAVRQRQSARAACGPAASPAGWAPG